MVDKARRGKPYVWVTWLTKLLAGEYKCWFAAWYKAHFKYEKIEDPERESFFAKYTAIHDKIVENRVERMRDDGWLVRVEDEGEFRLEGKLGTLAGKPDIVGIRDGIAVAIDGKSGKRRLSDHWQVLIYMLALPLTWLRGHTELHGEVQYRDGAEGVRELGDPERAKISEAMKIVAGPDRPETSPSSFECGRCDIASCPDRHKPNAPGDAKGLF